MSFYAVRGMPLDALAAATPAERGFLQGARALYYEKMLALISRAVALGIAQILPGGEQLGQ